MVPYNMARLQGARRSKSTQCIVQFHTAPMRTSDTSSVNLPVPVLT